MGDSCEHPETGRQNDIVQRWPVQKIFHAKLSSYEKAFSNMSLGKSLKDPRIGREEVRKKPGLTKARG